MAWTYRPYSVNEWAGQAVSEIDVIACTTWIGAACVAQGRKSMHSEHSEALRANLDIYSPRQDERTSQLAPR